MPYVDYEITLPNGEKKTVPVWQSDFDGPQVDQAVGAIVNGEIDKAAETAQAAAHTATEQAGQAASSAQAVKDALSTLPPGAVPVINDLTTGGTAVALSAEMGKKLQAEKADAAATEAALSDKAAYYSLTTPDGATPEAITAVIVAAAKDRYSEGTVNSSGLWSYSGANYGGGMYGAYLLYGPGVQYVVWVQGGTYRAHAIATAADLAGKMNNSYGELGAVDLLDWAKEQHTGGSFCINPSLGTTGVPVAGLWYNGTLDVNRESQTGPGRTVMLTPTNPGIRTRWENHLYSGQWVGWAEFPAATPPQEYDLPLAAGVTGYARYCKDQFGRGRIEGQLTLPVNSSGIVILGTLPAGYRPQYGAPAVSGGWLEGGTNVATLLCVANADGTVAANMFSSVVKYVIANTDFRITTSGANALQSQVRMPTTRAARAALQAEPVNKCMCVVDAEGNYVEFVMVTITHDELGALYTVHYYELGDGERLVDSQTPPAMRPHAGAEGFIRPRWDDETAAWVEVATAEETAAWEAEHPAPEPVGPTPDEQMRADIDYLAALGGVAL